jgi:hypothetical protein
MIAESMRKTGKNMKVRCFINLRSSGKASSFQQTKKEQDKTKKTQTSD